MLEENNKIKKLLQQNEKENEQINTVDEKLSEFLNFANNCLTNDSLFYRELNDLSSNFSFLAAE